MMDAPADAPIEKGEPYVDGNGTLPVSLLDQGTDLDQQLAGFLALQIQSSLRLPLPSYYAHSITVNPIGLGSMPPMGFSKERVYRFIAFLKTKLRLTVYTSKVETVHLEERWNPWHTRNCVTQGLLRLGRSYGRRGPREQYGNNLGRKTAQMIRARVSE
jgi:hypothetical protein